LRLFPINPNIANSILFKIERIMISRFTSRFGQPTKKILQRAAVSTRKQSRILQQRRTIAGPVELEPSDLHAREVTEAVSSTESPREPTAMDLTCQHYRSKYVPPKEFITVTRDCTLVEASSVMSNTGLGFGVLLVVENGLLLGKISERRIMYAVQKTGGNLVDAKVGDWMMSVTAWVSPSTPLYDIMEILSEKKVRHLVILGEPEDKPVNIETMSKGFRPTKKIQGVLSIKKVLEAGLMHSWETSMLEDKLD